MLLAQNAGRVVPRERILAELWRDHWGGASKTLDMHMSTLRRQLGEPEIITTFRGVGYRPRRGVRRRVVWAIVGSVVVTLLLFGLPLAWAVEDDYGDDLAPRVCRARRWPPRRS